MGNIVKQLDKLSTRYKFSCVSFVIQSASNDFVILGIARSETFVAFDVLVAEERSIRVHSPFFGFSGRIQTLSQLLIS